MVHRIRHKDRLHAFFTRSSFARIRVHDLCARWSGAVVISEPCAASFDLVPGLIDNPAGSLVPSERLNEFGVLSIALDSV